MSVVAHTRNVQHLYRRSLKTLLSWAVSRDVFNEEAVKLRQSFEANRKVESLKAAEDLANAGWARLEEFRHPDPYLAPVEAGGSKYQRNTPTPPELHDARPYQVP